MSFIKATEEAFRASCEALFASLEAGEALNCSLDAEDTLFLRFNANKVRQNTSVRQLIFSCLLQKDGRSVERSRTVSGNFAGDRERLLELLAECRAEAKALPVDPYQVPLKNNGESREIYAGSLPAAEAVIESITRAAEGADLAGLYCGGVVISANRNSCGQSHWFASETFYLDYSLYDGARAAKGGIAGAKWSDQEWRANLERTRSQLALLAKPLQTVKPGKYRTYLAPRAVADLLEMFAWGALSGAALKQGRSPFKKLAEGEVQLSTLFSLRENFALGLAPQFNSLGEVAPATLSLIEAGKIKNLLVSSKSAQEFGLAGNAAGENEVPRSLDLAPGTLEEKGALAALGTGLYLSNLHYLNWSDPVSARVTGMTRYACFWVENGAIVGPIKDLRFDESLFDALGANLEALTKECEIAPAISSYGGRALGGSRAPGALISEFTYTL